MGLFIPLSQKLLLTETSSPKAESTHASPETQKGFAVPSRSPLHKRRSRGTYMPLDWGRRLGSA